MLQVDTSFKGCIPRSVDIVDYFGKNTPFGRNYESSGFLQYIKSPENTNGFAKISAEIVNTREGKFVEMKFMSRTPMCLAVCTKDFECSPDQIPYSAPINRHKWKLTRRIVVCNGDGDEIKLEIDHTTFLDQCDVFQRNEFKFQQMEYVNQLGGLVNETIGNDLFGMIDLSSPVVMPILVKTQNNQVVTTNTWKSEIKRIAKDKGYKLEDYVAIGGHFLDLLDDAGAKLPFKTFYDSSFDSIFSNAGNMMVLIPKGTFQLAEYSFFKNEPLVKESLIRGFVQLPVYSDDNGTVVSIPVDYVYKEVDKDNCSTLSYAPAYWGEIVKAIPGDCKDSQNDGIIVIQNCGAEVIECPTP